MKKIISFALCLALYSVIALAGREKFNVLNVNIVENDDQTKVTLTRLPHDFSSDDRKFLSKVKTDLKVVIFSKSGDEVDVFYLKWFKDPSVGYGGSVDPKTGEPPFTRIKRYSTTNFKIKPSAYKVEVIVGEKVVASRLISKIEKFDP